MNKVSDNFEDMHKVSDKLLETWIIFWIHFGNVKKFEINFGDVDYILDIYYKRG